MHWYYLWRFNKRVHLQCLGCIIIRCIGTNCTLIQVELILIVYGILKDGLVLMVQVLFTRNRIIGKIISD